MKRIPTTIAALAVLAAGAVAASAEDAATGPDGLPPPGDWRHAVSLIGEPRLPARLRPFQLRQPGCAQGRHGAPVRRQPDLRHAQPDPRQGRHRRRARADLRVADHARDRRGRHRRRIWRDRRGAALPGRLSPTSPTGSTRRPSGMTAQPITRRRRGVVVRPDGEAQPEPALLLPARDQGRGDGDRRGDLHLRPEGQPRAARDRRRASDPAQALVGGHRRQRQQARHLQGHAGADAGLRRPTRSADVQAGRSITYERVPDFWGKDLNVNVGSNNFDKVTLRVLPRPQRRVRGVQGRRVRLLVGERGQALGDRPTTSRPCRPAR